MSQDINTFRRGWHEFWLMASSRPLRMRPDHGLAQRGAEMMRGSSAQLSAVVKAGLAKWAGVVKETGAKAD